ncbi:MAG: nucleoside-diphosphate sugar epimerase [Deltaproteobacteria bacterium RIFOXYD12_FULL_55_16]|nr:MAG: nucleoside-diphosphate sugar epimerase [Deltaproteobacteria bacterium RIFOXYD12_FULL_55_16]
MKIVVTGALGHIGSRLIRALPDSFPAAEIVLLDDLSTQRYCSLFNLPAQGDYRFLEADVMTADLDALFSGADVVVHLAAITNAAGSFEIADQVEKVNFNGTELVARACLRTGAALMFFSSTSVYGTQAEVVDEDCGLDELKPQSPYADSKLRSEEMLKIMGREQGLRFISCRFGTIFGVSPGMRFHTAVNKFAWQACMGIPLTVWTTALDQKRPYLDVEDGIRAIRFIIERDLFDGQIYNILTANATVRQIVDTIREFVPDLEVSLVDARIMNQLSYTVSEAKFSRLGFQATGSLRQQLGDTVAMLRGVRRW